MANELLGFADFGLKDCGLFGFLLEIVLKFHDLVVDLLELLLHLLELGPGLLGFLLDDVEF